MAIHPSENELLLAVGDKWGNLGVCSHLFMYLFVCLLLFGIAISNSADIYNQMLRWS
jgi:cell division protein FtsW (lipid II flippase)